MTEGYAAMLTAAAYSQRTVSDVVHAYAADAVDTPPAEYTEVDLVRATSDRPDAIAALWLRPPQLDIPLITAACRTPRDSALAWTLIRNTEFDFAQETLMHRALAVLLKPHQPATGNVCQPCDSRWPCRVWEDVHLWISGYFDPVTGGRVTMAGEHWTGKLCPLDPTRTADDNCKCAEFDARLRGAMTTHQLTR